MNYIPALIIAVIVGLIADKIINPLVESRFSDAYSTAHPKVILAIEFLISGALGVLFAWLLSANMFTDTSGVTVTPLGGIVVTGIIAGFGSGGINAVLQVGSAVKTLAVAKAESVKAQAEADHTQVVLAEAAHAQAVYTKAQTAPSGMATKPVA